MVKSGDKRYYREQYEHKSLDRVRHSRGSIRGFFDDETYDMIKDYCGKNEIKLSDFLYVCVRNYLESERKRNNGGR